MRVDDGDPVWAAVQCDLPYAYVVYDHARKGAVTVIREWLETLGIYLAGRYSEWEYYNSDHAFIAGRKAADTILGLDSRVQPASSRKPWAALQKDTKQITSNRPPHTG